VRGQVPEIEELAEDVELSLAAAALPTRTGRDRL